MRLLPMDECADAFNHNALRLRYGNFSYICKRMGETMFRMRHAVAMALCMAMAGVLLTGSPGRAAESGFSIGVGGSVSTSPYKDYDAQWLPLPLVAYESEYFYIRGVTAGVKLFTHDHLELSVFGGYDPTSFDPDDSDNSRLRRLRDRWSSAVAGMGVRVMTPYGELHATLAGDVLGHSDGFTGTVGYGYALEFDPVELTLDVGAYWADANYNDYYYGVSGKEARKSGLDAYNAGSGFSPYLSLTVGASFAENWAVFCKGEIVSLSGTVKDSPMVDESFTQNVTVGLTYSF